MGEVAFKTSWGGSERTLAPAKKVFHRDFAISSLSRLKVTETVQTEDWYSIEIDRFAEETGMLSVLEYGKHIPFAVKRVFWVGNVPSNSIARGGHAHAELKQVIFCSNGSCNIDLENVSGAKETILLADTGSALYVNGPVWRTMRDFSSDCSMIVLCDREYHLDQVIRDYQKFRSL